MSGRFNGVWRFAALFLVLVTHGSSAHAEGGGAIFTVAGRTSIGTDLLPLGGAATDLRLGSDARQPTSVLARRDGGFLVALSTQILRVDRRGLLHAFAGTSQTAYTGGQGDGGPATSAGFGDVSDMATLTDGSIVVADRQNGTVRVIPANGRIGTLVGRRPAPGETGRFAGDGGPASGALLCLPTSLAPLPAGGLLIADACNHRVREVTSAGTIRTVAGTGIDTADGDGGLATSAAIGRPVAVAAMPDGGFVIGSERDSGAAGEIRRVAPDGRINTIASFAARSLVGMPDGGILAAREGPAGLPRTIVRISAQGLITPLAGRAVNASSQGPPHADFDGDTGDPLDAPLAISDLSQDSDGGLLIADAGADLGVNASNGALGGRVRVLTPRTPQRLAIGISRATLSAKSKIRATFTATRRARLTAILNHDRVTVRKRVVTVAAGRHALTLATALRPGGYELELRARGTQVPHATASDHITLFASSTLTVASSRRIVREYVRQGNENGAGFDSPSRCRRFGPRRVDCAVTGGDLCQFVEAIFLRSDGTVANRFYRDGTDRCRFLARPHWNGPPLPFIP